MMKDASLNLNPAVLLANALSAFALNLVRVAVLCCAAQVSSSVCEADCHQATARILPAEPQALACLRFPETSTDVCPVCPEMPGA